MFNKVKQFVVSHKKELAIAATLFAAGVVIESVAYSNGYRDGLADAWPPKDIDAKFQVRADDYKVLRMELNGKVFELAE